VSDSLDDDEHVPFSLSLIQISLDLFTYVDTRLLPPQERLRAWKLQLEQEDSASDGALDAADQSLRVQTQPASSEAAGAGFSWDGFKSAAGELQGQNTQLLGQVARADAEVARLRLQVEHLRSVQDTLASDSPADAKVLQLAKKVKTLAVAGSVFAFEIFGSG
jgi:hypothetical protein